MTETENVADNAAEPENTGALIARTAVRTVVSTVAALVLIVSLIVVFFPYNAMKAYMSLNMKARALESAESYIALNEKKYSETPAPLDSRYVSACYVSCELAISLYGKAEDKADKAFYADKIIEHTQRYLSLYRIAEHNDEISRYNVSHQPYYYYHPSFYNYRDSLVGYNYTARCETDKRSGMIIDGVLSTTDNATSLFYNRELEITENNVIMFTEILNMLSAMVAYDFETAGGKNYSSMTERELGLIRLDPESDFFAPLAAKGNTRPLLITAIEEKFDAIETYALDKMKHSTPWETLGRLYVVRSLARFADNMYRMTATLAANDLYAAFDNNYPGVWKSLGRIEGTEWSLTDYYNNVLLPDYAKQLTSKNQ